MSRGGNSILLSSSRPSYKKFFPLLNQNVGVFRAVFVLPGWIDQLMCVMLSLRSNSNVVRKALLLVPEWAILGGQVASGQALLTMEPSDEHHGIELTPSFVVTNALVKGEQSYEGR